MSVFDNIRNDLMYSPCGGDDGDSSDGDFGGGAGGGFGGRSGSGGRGGTGGGGFGGASGESLGAGDDSGNEAQPVVREIQPAKRKVATPAGEEFTTLGDKLKSAASFVPAAMKIASAVQNPSLLSVIGAGSRLAGAKFPSTIAEERRTPQEGPAEPGAEQRESIAAFQGTGGGNNTTADPGTLQEPGLVEQVTQASPFGGAETSISSPELLAKTGVTSSPPEPRTFANTVRLPVPTASRQSRFFSKFRG